MCSTCSDVPAKRLRRIISIAAVGLVVSNARLVDSIAESVVARAVNEWLLEVKYFLAVVVGCDGYICWSRICAAVAMGGSADSINISGVRHSLWAKTRLRP